MPLNSIQQLISSTTRMASDRSYLMLFQHSKHPARHVMAASESTDVQVYRRARVRTPAENAQRDFFSSVWLHHFATELVNAHKGLVYVKTIGAKSHHSIESLSQVTILDAACNPFGWDNDSRQDWGNDDDVTCEDLQKLVHVIQSLVEKQKRPIVIESLTPILMRHGLPRTMVFLQQLIKLNTTILVPILVETLSPAQNRAVEDLAQALLYLHNGDLVLVRQGVRERGNVLRETVLYNVHTNEATEKISLEILTTKEETKDETGVSVDHTTSLGELTLNDDDKDPLPVRPGKVKLEIENEDNGSSAAIQEQANRPHIYVQDNDIEFEDLDEEDPDDDLDI